MSEKTEPLRAASDDDLINELVRRCRDRGGEDEQKLLKRIRHAFGSGSGGKRTSPRYVQLRSGC